MSELLFHYHKVNPTTWVYLSSLLTIGLFFKFSRLWSIRNLDLVFLILLAPGLLLVEHGLSNHLRGIEQAGYIWIFVMNGVLLVRLLLDPMMIRRPLLEPNLSVGGMTFLGLSLLVFLMANVANGRLTRDDLAGARGADKVRTMQTPAPDDKSLARHGPGYPLLHLLPILYTQALYIQDPSRQTVHERNVRRDEMYKSTARTMAIISHLAIVIGMVMIGYRHFDNIKTGIAAATLYLMLPYTAQLTGRVDHVLPAAFLVWAVEAYRRPLVAGMMMGLAIGVIYYPVFLLPLWLGFYWQRGLLRFSLGVVLTVALLVGSLAFTSDSFDMFLVQTKQMFGWTSLNVNDFEGFWALGFVDQVYRIPVLAAFLALCLSLALWPAQKNLGTLMSCSAAVMLGTQFCHAHFGGLYMAWYLPLLLLTIFRPNLEDRVALSVLGEGWLPRRRAAADAVERAA